MERSVELMDLKRVLDSSTKIPMSLLKGNIYDFGNFEECLSVNVKEEWGAFVGQHCVTEIPIPYLLNSKYIPKNSEASMAAVCRILAYQLEPCRKLFMINSSYACLNLYCWNNEQYIGEKSRILPVLAMMVLLELTLIPKLGHGPLWDIAIVNTQKKDCEDYWWATLLFVQNYIDVKKMCIPVAWFLAVDMQLYWLSPLFLLALHKKPKLGLNLVLCSGLLGILVSFQQAYYYQDLPSALPTKQKNVVCGWLISITILIGVIQWLYQYEQVDYEYNVLDAALYFAIARPLWAVGIAWIIFACDSGYGGFVNTILGWNALLPLSRLTFSMYLVHFDILVKSMGMMKVAGYVSEIGLVCILSN
ncbi:hypothetical protein C0J52_05793 [Blattella germanica]|nr:hypothetical protein C0J52_05793 [Blattella germanica]